MEYDALTALAFDEANNLKMARIEEGSIGFNAIIPVEVKKKPGIR